MYVINEHFLFIEYIVEQPSRKKSKTPQTLKIIFTVVTLTPYLKVIDRISR